MIIGMGIIAWLGKERTLPVELIPEKFNSLEALAGIEPAISTLRGWRLLPLVHSALKLFFREYFRKRIRLAENRSLNRTPLFWQGTLSHFDRVLVSKFNFPCVPEGEFAATPCVLPIMYPLLSPSYLIHGGIWNTTGLFHSDQPILFSLGF